MDISRYQYYAAINDKLANKSKETSAKVNVGKLNKHLTNDLLGHYNTVFNENYDLQNKLNKEIMNRDRLIDINQDAYQHKNIIVQLLKYLLFLLFIYIFLAIGFTMNIYPVKTLLYIIIIGTVLYIIFVSYQIYYDPLFFKYRHELSDDSSFLHNLSHVLLPDFFNRRDCPKYCRKKIPHDDQNYPILSDQIKEMKTDSTIDVWAKSDIDKADATEKDMKKKYRCYWDGSMKDFNGGRINRINNMPYIFSTDIPCKYFPGYKEKKS